MKPIVRLAVMLLAILSPVVYAADGAPTIVARWTNVQPPLDPASAAWEKLAPAPVALYPQLSVPLSVPPAAAEGSATLQARALYNEKTVALHLEWAAPKPAMNRAVGEFADAAAVQWPSRTGPDARLPYVGMGNPGAPVALWFWRADGSVETLAAEGFGTLTTQKPDGVKAKGIWKDGKWRVVFTRPLRPLPGDERVSFDPAKQGVVPVALATWSGEAQERNGRKQLSAWHALRFEKGRADNAYARRLAGMPIEGDAENGRRLLTEKGCAGCHAFPGNLAQPAIGPALTNAGGIHATEYLLESLSDPSRVIVPGKKYSMVQDGKRVSLMPPFAGTDAERRDVVTFIKTLH